MKRIVKILVILIITLATIVIYLSLYGVKTDKFNKEIIKNVSKINKKINLSLNEVKFAANSSKGAVRRMRTRIGLLAQPEPMRSIIGATQ